jgi:hypothetical protein
MSKLEDLTREKEELKKENYEKYLHNLTLTSDELKAATEVFKQELNKKYGYNKKLRPSRQRVNITNDDLYGKIPSEYITPKDYPDALDSKIAELNKKKTISNKSSKNHNSNKSSKNHNKIYTVDYDSDSDNDIEEITDTITQKNDSLDEGTPYFTKLSDFSRKLKNLKKPFVNNLLTRKNLSKVHPTNTDSPTFSIDSETKGLSIRTPRSLSNKRTSLKSNTSQKSLGGKRWRKSNKKTRKYRKK